MMTLFDDCATAETPPGPRQNTREIVEKLQENNQDFEWYPTTDPMIAAVAQCCQNYHSMLDIGAGDGRVLKRVQSICKQHYETRRARGLDDCTMGLGPSELYAIEKSTSHIEAMPAEISIIGTDFLLQSLIDKPVDAIFCNPPYKHYEEWTLKILQEAHCNSVFLVIPSRWKENPAIVDVVKKRGFERILWSGDFLAADRPSRARVDVLSISIRGTGRYGSRNEEKADPFDAWFTTVFPEFDRLNPQDDINDENLSYSEKEEKQKAARKQRFALIPGQNLIERLAELYRQDMDNLFKNYRALCGLDAELLKELGIKHGEVKQGLKSKISGRKNLYWTELFEHLHKVTSRLTKKSREAILEKLAGSMNIDFTADNAYAVVIWTVKNANQYISDQIKDLFMDLSSPENVKNYKSNQRTWQRGKWRYDHLENGKPNHSHYMLDYRIVTEKHSAIKKAESWQRQENMGMSENCHDFLNDILTVANNLGFVNSADSRRHKWASGASVDFYDAKGKVLLNVRAFYNGNVHLKFNQDFIKTFNIEASRLLGWIRTPQEAAQEMGMDINYVKSRYNTVKTFGPAEQKLLLTA